MSSTRRKAVVHAAALAVLATLAWACGPATSSGPGPVSPEAPSEAATGSSPAEDAACVPFVAGGFGEPRDMPVLLGWMEPGRLGGPDSPAAADFHIWVRAEDRFHIGAGFQGDVAPAPVLIVADGACEVARGESTEQSSARVSARLGPGVYTVRVALPEGEASERAFRLTAHGDGPGATPPDGACDTFESCCAAIPDTMAGLERICETVDALRAIDGGDAMCLTALTGLVAGIILGDWPLPEACRPAGP